jgi:hypothetical protein
MPEVSAEACSVAMATATATVLLRDRDMVWAPITQ